MSVRILEGDALQVLQTLPDCSVQMCVTSPPYFGLRDYGVAGQLGLEKTPDLYVEAMVGVLREVNRVLRDDGTLWLNIGDSYAGGKQGRDDASRRNGAGVFQDGVFKESHAGGGAKQRAVPDGLKPKDLIGIPWLLAFALRADGWYLRSDIIWHKPNPMPESVTDRPTKSHEYLFLLSKSPTYYYDSEAIAEVSLSAGELRSFSTTKKAARVVSGREGTGNERPGAPMVPIKAQRNRRSVWTVCTTPYREAHFATFPPDLIEPCILAGSAKQSCEKCGAPWERLTETERVVRTNGGASPKRVSLQTTHDVSSGLVSNKMPHTRTIGFASTCDCENSGTGKSLVLDPFGGAGTTGLVADRLGRDALLIELNPKYAEMARRRIHSDNPLFGDVA